MSPAHFFLVKPVCFYESAYEKEPMLHSGRFTPLLRVCCSQSPLEQQVLLAHGPLPEEGLQHAELHEQRRKH